MSIEPIRRPGLEQVPTEVTDWLQNLFVRLRAQLSTLQCLCMTAEAICDGPTFNAGSREDLCLPELPVALWEVKERLHTLISEINPDSEVE